ncbi:MAG TPA: family 78 glycoside hydrolase catalytic domain, partial [Fimbriimonas sp.]|nr:family 78 glycoside hydrolase catalytic domain [Fimbriimonas sp.]
YSYVPSPYMRREFSIGKAIAQARLYITALGIYEAHLNGQKIGEAELAPGWTDYARRVRYQTYDVTALLGEGVNCLGAILGDGWFSGHLAWLSRETYGDPPKLLAQLAITYQDGSTETIATGPDWSHGFGAVRSSDLLMGEVQDLRKEPAGWDRPGFAANGWMPVEATKYETKLVAQYAPLIEAVEEIKPVSVRMKGAWPSDRFIFDMGQNMVGKIRFRVQGTAGQTLTFRFAERLDKDGGMYTTNYRSARSTDYVTLAGNGEEVFETKFTFHGFQYVEVAGLSEPPTVDNLSGIVLHSAWEPTGDFSCSEPLLNQLQSNIRWGWKGNSLDVPTDCPQRDERLGWTGDAQVFGRTACFLSDAQTFFEKYQQDLEDSTNADGQIPPVAPTVPKIGIDGGPAWSDAFVICPWTAYRVYGDTTILERHYDAMRKWVDSLQISSRDDIRSYEGYTGFKGFGDWLNTNAETPIELIGTAFYAYSSAIFAKIAAALGNREDAKTYGALSERVKKAFQNRFVTPSGLVSSGTQTAYVLALHFDLLPSDLRAPALQLLVDDIGWRGWKLSTGFVGTSYLPHVLTEGGRLDVAYKLLMQKGWPSWLYAVTQGATTIWERWDGWTEDKGFQDPGMNSFNHYAYGAIGEWLVSTVAGIDLDPDVPAYKKSRLAPRPGGGLTQAQAHLKTRFGKLSSSWAIEGGKFRWNIVVPPNADASTVFPPEASNPTCNGVAVPNQQNLPAGSYEMVADWLTE